jgi:hypothetical protein
MKRITFLFLIIAFIGAPFIATQTMAGQQVGTFCWDITPYADQLELAVTDEGNGNYLFVGKAQTWLYLLPCVGSGSMTPQDLPPQQTLKMGLHCTNDTELFDGINDCVFKSTLDIETLSGPVELDCGSGAFTATGTLVPTQCPISPPIIGDTNVIGR